MTVLDVPGAWLYYEIHGSGPLLMLIPGASGTAEGFRAVTTHLAAHYSVVLYDRRGFSRSRLDGPQDDSRRLQTDADDLRRLAENLGNQPAIVFGASSGGIVSCEVLARHPAVVDTLVPFEPPAMRYLPDGEVWLRFFTEVYELYRRSGVEPALDLFRSRAFAEIDRQAMARAMSHNQGDQARANAVHWFEHELRQYPAAVLDWDALAAHAERVLPAAGTESRGYPAHQAALEVSTRLGLQLTELPGGHLGCMTHAAEFAVTLMRALEASR